MHEKANKRGQHGFAKRGYKTGVVANEMGTKRVVTNEMGTKMATKGGVVNEMGIKRLPKEMVSMKWAQKARSGHQDARAAPKMHTPFQS